MAISRSQLNRGQRSARADMTDRCAASVDKGSIWDDGVGKDVPLSVLIYQGRCEVKWSEQVVTTANGLTVEGYVLKVPVDAVELPIGARVRVVSSARDPLMAGRVFLVSRLAVGSHLMARRYQVKEVTGPNG